MAEYIKREAAVKAANEWVSEACMAPVMRVSRLFDKLQKVPAADVAPVVHGRWIEDHDYLKCPECGVMVKWDFTFFDIGNWNYCPNCGAKMDIEDGGDSDAQKDKRQAGAK